MHGPALVTLLVLASFATPVRTPHDGPDPVWHWIGTSQRVDADGWRARLGPEARLEGEPKIYQDEHGEAVWFDGRDDRAFVADDLGEVRDQLPTRLLTVSAWVSVETPQSWGGIFGVLQDNGGKEKGLIVGYDQSVFTFGLSTTGADDGDGSMTYLKGSTRYEVGRLYHVVATYDGARQRLYVNGNLDAESMTQSGDILYPDEAPVTLGCYRDQDEDYRHHGRIREVAMYDLCAKPAWVAQEFIHDAGLSELPAVRNWPDEFEFLVEPNLQFVTQDGVTVVFETTRPCSAVVRFGEDQETPRLVESDRATTLHQLRMADLKTQMGYFYRVALTDERGETLEFPLRSFQTAVERETPFGFAVISDTQSNPAVSQRIAEHAFGQRPNFVLIPGDLVGTGTNKAHWTREFFPSMSELLSRVAFFPVLGNHEQDARHYYDYMSLPDPEYYYSFDYGNAEFFVVDTNRNVDPDSEQYEWLAEALSESDATWKFVSHHHPAYSSDENDYGDMWTGKSTHGDVRVRQLTELYDRHDVDIVFNGHIHSYERTWPVEAGQVAEGGTIYMITGGGGGGLETPGPIKPWFQNNVRRGHHYCTVSIAGGRLELKTFDLENRLFDLLVLEKD
ncbi:MAG: metallophosphoesterase [Planctomycetota bacterium]